MNSRRYDWLGDSAYMVHVMSRHEAFATYETLEKKPIKGVGGMRTYTVGRGTIYLHSECDGAVHIPPTPLIGFLSSVSYVAKASRLLVT